MKDSITNWDKAIGSISLLYFLSIPLLKMLSIIFDNSYISAIACVLAGYFLHRVIKIAIYHDLSTITKKISFNRFLRDLSIFSKSIILVFAYRIIFNQFNSDNESDLLLIYLLIGAICFEVFYAIYQLSFSNKVNS